MKVAYAEDVLVSNMVAVGWDALILNRCEDTEAVLHDDDGSPVATTLHRSKDVSEETLACVHVQEKLEITRRPTFAKRGTNR
jgi:hypothetical protein